MGQTEPPTLVRSKSARRSGATGSMSLLVRSWLSLMIRSMRSRWAGVRLNSRSARLRNSSRRPPAEKGGDNRGTAVLRWRTGAWARSECRTTRAPVTSPSPPMLMSPFMWRPQAVL